MSPTRAKNGTAFEWHGDPENSVVVLIHGLGLTRDTWEGHIEALSKRYRVLNYDLFGHGESEPPPRRPDLSLYGRQLNEMLNELDVERASLIGFSLGGMINRRFAMDYPDKVSALVILNSPHERSPAAQELVEQRAADTSAGGPEATLDATIERWFTSNYINLHGNTISRIRNWVLANDPTTYAQCRQVLAHGVLELIRPKPAIEHPTLVMTCEHDSGSTPAMCHAISSELKNSEAIIVPTLQHMGLVEQPELFTVPILEFLSKH